MLILISAFIAAISPNPSSAEKTKTSEIRAFQVGHEVTMRPMPPDVIAAWIKAGAEYGRVGTDETGEPCFEAVPVKLGDLPAFFVSGLVNGKQQPFSLAGLPAPDVPFGLFTFVASNVAVRDLAALKQLQVLDLNGVYVTDEGARELAALKHLQTLVLCSTQVTDEGVKALAALKQLESLDLSSTKVGDSGVKALAALKHLRTLQMRGTQVADEGVKALAAFEQLRTLNLGKTQVTDAGLKELAALHQLRSLCLCGTQVTDTGVKELAAIENLESLDLRYTNVGDAGMKDLTALKHLRTLLLYGTGVTDEGVKALSDLQSPVAEPGCDSGCGCRTEGAGFSQTTTNSGPEQDAGDRYGIEATDWSQATTNT
jgi:internalin A